MNFARLSSTPSARGSAPPESPVPAPRATTRHAVARARAHDLLHLLDRVGKHRDQGNLTVRGESVAFVRLQGLLGVEHRCGRQEAAKLTEHNSLAAIVVITGTRLVHRLYLILPGGLQTALTTRAGAAT